MTGYGKLEKFLSHIEWILSKLYWNIQASPSNNKPKQEWSSMESNSYENWDEIEMFFGHLVICNW